jgi:L,D-transpeptidase YcbB
MGGNCVWEWAKRVSAALVLALSICAGAARAAPVDEVLRERLSQLETVGRIDVGGSPIVARLALPKIYEANGYQPYWTAQELTTLLGLIADSAQDGLTPEDYHLAALTKLAPAASTDPGMRAQADLLATDAYYHLLYHLYFGKVDPVYLHPTWNFEARQDVSPDIEHIVQEALAQNRLADAVARARPSSWLYEKMRSALAEYRDLEAKGGWQAVPEGETLKAGSRGSRVVALRHRLAVSGDLAGQALDDDVFDEPLASAVRTFQERHRLTPDGSAGGGTLKEINVPVATRIGQIRVNLERGRWVLHEITTNDLVVVDVAGFDVRYLRDRQATWRARAQVGKTYRQTPIFKSTIDHVVFNPTWTVPPGILDKDILPAVRRDRGALAKKKLQVIDRSGQPVDPSSVDWNRYNGNNFPYMLRQGPGPDNALGQVKIMFPNPYLVYLHDTPSKALFEKSERAFSSGCIRVQHALELAQAVLNDPANWNDASIDAVLKSGETRTVRLRNPVPVLVMYWTIDPTHDGHPVFKRDPYNRDAKLLAALDSPAASTK